MRYFIGRGLQLAAILTVLFILYLGMTEQIRPGRELMLLAGPAGMFAIGWMLAGGAQK